MCMELRRVKKALGTLLREALEARGLPVEVTVIDGALRYKVDGEWLSPGQAAEKLGVQW